MDLKTILRLYYISFRYRYFVNKGEIGYLLRSIRPSDTVIDIGAHKGGYLFWMQKKAGDKGKVIGFEPQTMMYQTLLETARFFKWDHVTLENCGLSDHTGTSRFFIPDSHSGASAEASIHHHRFEEGKFKETLITTDTLDNYCTAHQLRPAFIKIDVEGHEYEVIRGGLETLRTNKPKILVECEQRHLENRKIQDLFELLLSLDYRGSFIYQSKLLPIAEFSLEKHQDTRLKNFEVSGSYANNFVFE